MEKAGFQGENNRLHHIIKNCIIECTPSEGELWRLLDRLNREFHVVCVLLGGFHNVMCLNSSQDGYLI